MEELVLLPSCATSWWCERRNQPEKQNNLHAAPWVRRPGESDCDHWGVE